MQPERPDGVQLLNRTAELLANRSSSHEGAKATSLRVTASDAQRRLASMAAADERGDRDPWWTRVGTRLLDQSRRVRRSHARSPLPPVRRRRSPPFSPRVSRRLDRVCLLRSQAAGACSAIWDAVHRSSHLAVHKSSRCDGCPPTPHLDNGRVRVLEGRS